MSAELTPFNYRDTAVRVIVIDGEPQFVLADLCKVLELSAVGRVAARLDEGVRRTHTLQTAGGPQQMTVVSESGMYEVVIRSDKPEAVAFRRWITGEVLPAIRRTGTYSTAPALTGPELVAAALIEANKMLTAKDEKIAELEPKAAAYERFMDSDGTYAVGTVAKLLGLSQNKLFQEMRARGVLIAKGAMRNTPYQRYMHHFAVKAYEFERTDGSTGTSYTTRVVPSGVEFIASKLGQPILASVTA